MGGLCLFERWATCTFIRGWVRVCGGRGWGGCQCTAQHLCSEVCGCLGTLGPLPGHMHGLVGGGGRGSRPATVPQGCGAGTHARAGHGGKGGAGRVGCLHNLDDTPVLGLLHLPPQHRALISGIALYTRVGGL